MEIIDEIQDFVSRRMRVIADSSSSTESAPSGDKGNVAAPAGRAEEVLVAKLICGLVDNDVQAIKSVVAQLDGAKPQELNFRNVKFARRPYNLCFYATVAASAEAIECLFYHEGVIQRVATIDVNSTCSAGAAAKAGYPSLHSNHSSGSAGENVTPLHLAAVKGAFATAKVLVISGANVRAARNRSVTPLHDAVCACADDVIENPPLLTNGFKSTFDLTASFRDEIKQNVRDVARGGGSLKRKSTRGTGLQRKPSKWGDTTTPTHSKQQPDNNGKSATSGSDLESFGEFGRKETSMASFPTNSPRSSPAQLSPASSPKNKRAVVLDSPGKGGDDQNTVSTFSIASSPHDYNPSPRNQSPGPSSLKGGQKVPSTLDSPKKVRLSNLGSSVATLHASPRQSAPSAGRLTVENNIFFAMGVFLGMNGADVDINGVEGVCPFTATGLAVLQRVQQVVQSQVAGATAEDETPRANNRRANSTDPYGKTPKKKKGDAREGLATPPGESSPAKKKSVNEQVGRMDQGLVQVLKQRRLYDAIAPSYKTVISGSFLAKRCVKEHEYRVSVMQHNAPKQKITLPDLVVGDFVTVSPNFKPGTIYHHSAGGSLPAVAVRKGSPKKKKKFFSATSEETTEGEGQTDKTRSPPPIGEATHNSFSHNSFSHNSFSRDTQLPPLAGGTVPRSNSHVNLPSPSKVDGSPSLQRNKKVSAASPPSQLRDMANGCSNLFGKSFDVGNSDVIVGEIVWMGPVGSATYSASALVQQAGAGASTTQPEVPAFEDRLIGLRVESGFEHAVHGTAPKTIKPSTCYLNDVELYSLPAPDHQQQKQLASTRAFSPRGEPLLTQGIGSDSHGGNFRAFHSNGVLLVPSMTFLTPVGSPVDIDVIHKRLRRDALRTEKKS